VEFVWCTLPIGLKIGEDGDLHALSCVRTELNEMGEFVKMDNAAFEVSCDLVIPAIGQSPLIEFLSTLRDLKMEKGSIVVNRATGETSNAKYFAGGDCANGGREVVDAVADGKRAALGIAARLQVALEVGRG
jgi:glutamate synthase (NADPH/NADH) small chain